MSSATTTSLFGARSTSASSAIPSSIEAGSFTSFQCAENIKMNRATIAGIQPPSIKDPASDRKVPFEPSFFDFTTLQRFGK